MFRVPSRNPFHPLLSHILPLVHLVRKLRPCRVRLRVRVPMSETEVERSLWWGLIVETLSTGGIVGIIAGCAVVAVIWGGWSAWHRSRKNRKRIDEMALEGKPTWWIFDGRGLKAVWLNGIERTVSGGYRSGNTGEWQCPCWMYPSSV